MVAEAHVLVIDDEETVCKSCVRILSEKGHSVKTALNGEEGLRQFEGGHFDLVIADLKMPGTGGIGVLTQVKERSPETAVIVITGYASVATAIEAMKLGAADYIEKPFTPDELALAAAKALERRADRAVVLPGRRELIGEKTSALVSRSDFPEMLKGLGREVYVPRGSEKGLRYSLAGQLPGKEVVWGGIRPVDPLKVFFFDPRRRVAVYPAPWSELVSGGEAGELRRVIAGVKRCDFHALSLLDKVFLEGDFVDPFYKAARENTLIVTTDCSDPGPSCSCVLMGLNPFCEEGFDLNVSEVSDGLIVEAGSDRGRNVVETIKERAKEVSPSNLVEREERRRRVQELMKARLADFLPEEPYEELVKRAADSPVWDECAVKCVGCAACTQICPTCHCFFLFEQAQRQARLEGRYEIIRAWDSCQYPAFARVAGGANPRKSVAGRFLHRYTDKFVDFKEAYGAYGCTGCGRCIDVCMGKIDMREVLWKLSGAKV
jgi:FixJ family two-component response regulator/ferredoxin